MTAPTWTPVCAYEQIQPERGVTALVNGEQIAVFRTHDGGLFAIDNLDPCSGAQVLARGIVGTRRNIAVVSSPMHKQAFNLLTGDCLDMPHEHVRTYPVRERDGIVEVGRLP